MSLAADKTAIRTLKKYLEKNSNILAKIIEDFPSANQKLTLPSASIFTKDAIFTPFPPEVVKQEDHPSDPTKIILTQEVGNYEIPIQVDLWTDYKEKRSELYQHFFRVMNQQYFEKDLPMGLSIELFDYHNSIARYELVGYNYPDGGDESIRGEWRVLVKLEISFRAMERVIRSKMSEIQIVNQIGGDAEDDTEIEETFII